MQTNDYTKSWQDIEPRLPSLQPVPGGYSQAQRGLVTLASGNQVFVKCAVNESTETWTRREIKVYAFLERHDFSHIPRLLAHNSDTTGFALEALLPEDGWNWQPEWDETRLKATLTAMNELAALQPNDVDTILMSEHVFGEADNGWSALEQSVAAQKLLRQKLITAGRKDVAEIDFAHAADQSRHFAFANDTLVHHDVRADNCAWHAGTGQVKLVDWNWMQLGDRRIDLGGFLVHVHKSGFDVLANHADLLDRGALHWLAGFWFNAAAAPIWPGGPNDLRDHQLQSGLVAWDLARSL